MTSGRFLRALICLCLAGKSLSIPSFDSVSFDDGSLLPLGGLLKSRSEPFEIRGVYGGRKKRYIIERDEDSACCKEKLICFPTLGEIIKDCKCQKCPTGFPALGGTSCQEKCPEGQEKNEKGGCCPTGQKPKPTGDGCEPRQDVNDKKGGCPDDKVLDPKYGWDPKKEDLVCQIDDDKSCPKPKIPGTRPPGTENDPSYKVECGEPDKDENKRPKCNTKTHYVHVTVQSDGSAAEECKVTKKYNDRKLGKPPNGSLRAKIKEMFTKLKPAYDEKDQQRKDNLEKLKKLQEQREKEAKDRGDVKQSDDDRKKERQAKCNGPIALLMGAIVNQAMAKRDEEHPYDWTTDYFDEDYVTSDARLKDWPTDIDINDISAEVDADAFLKGWDEILDENKRQPQSCNFVRMRSLDRRCSQKRSLEDWYDNFDQSLRPNNTSIMLRRDTGPIYHPDMSLYESGELRRRNPIAVLLNILARFATGLGAKLVARATASVSAHAPRVGALLSKGERLFQVAQKGQGTKAGQQGMDRAQEAIKKDYKRWWKCLKEGRP